MFDYSKQFYQIFCKKLIGIVEQAKILLSISCYP